MDIKGLDQINASAPFNLPPLPYSKSALAPHISEQTLSFHYEKHHHKYVTTTNELIKNTKFEKSNLEQIVMGTAGNSEFQKLFNNASQAWNHWFYWNCLDPRGVRRPEGALAKALDTSFGGYEKFATEFTNAALEQFGSGYAWLIKKGDKLQVQKTSNAENPITMGAKPILSIDVWEHAYYLDYQNRRQDYVATYLDNLVNWEFASLNFNNN